MAAVKAAPWDECCCPALLHTLFQLPAAVKASRRSVPIDSPNMWKYQLTAAVPAGTVRVSVLGELDVPLDASRYMKFEPPCAFAAPVLPDGVVLPRAQ